jgi:cytochrome c peroxidase
VSVTEKKGARIFPGKGGCVTCHAVAGRSNGMFSDFRMHVIGVPRIASEFGAGRGNVIFDGSAEIRRNVSLQPTFFHNGAFTRPEDAIYHHLHVFESARNYDPIRARVDRDLTLRLGPVEPALARLDPVPSNLPHLTPEEFRELSRVGSMIPATLPGGCRR